MAHTLKDVAKELAAAHREADSKTDTIKLIPSSNLDEIRLLEVSSSVPSTGEVLPFRYAPDPDHGIDYASVVVLLSPDEWNLVQQGSLHLPQDWVLNGAEDL